MASEGFSTGSIFVSVVPVFKDFQNEIAREAEKANARAKKDAADVGREHVKQAELTAGEISKINARERAKAEKEELAAAKRIADAKVKQARDANAQQIKDENALREAEQKRLRDQMEGDAKAAKARADLFEKQTRKEWAEADKLAREIEKTKSEADASARAAKAALDRHIATTETANARMRAEAIKAEKEIAEVRQKEWERTAGTFARSFQKEMKKASEAISKDASGALAGARREMERLSTMRVGIDISEADAAKAANRLYDTIRRVGRSKRINARDLIDVSAAERGLRSFVQETGKAHRAAGLLGRGLKGLHQDGLQAANSFRVFNPFLIAVVGTLSVMPALTSAAAGGILALGTSGLVASTGIAALAFGFSGLGDAMTAMQNQADASGKEMKAQGDSIKQATYAVSDARKALADAERSAAQAAEDAARRVADARESAADSIQDALERQREAQEAYADSIRSVREAEVALQEARKQARADAQDLGLQIRGNKLAQEEGLLNEFDAKVAFDAARADGSATNAEVEQARINWEQAKLQQERLRLEGSRLAEEKKKWDKEGVEGSDVVKSAQERLTDAIEAQRDAVTDLGEASRAVDEARTQGARDVADALRDQSRVNADNARSIASARESLRRAQESLTSTSAEVSATATATEIAMGKLSNAGRNFAVFMMGVKSDFRDLRNEIQEVFLPDVQAAFTDIIKKNGPGFRAFMLSMAGVMGAFFTDLAESVNGPEMQAFFGAFANLAPEIQGNLNSTFISFLEALAGILRASLPFTLAFSAALANLAETFSEWANSTKGQEAITDFLENAAKIGPEVLDFFGDLVTFLFHFGQAMMPISLAILEGLGDFLGFLSGLDPVLLQAIAVGLLAVFAFVQVVSGVGALLAGFALVSTGLAVFIGAVLGLAAAFVILWSNSDTFREKVRALMSFLGEQFSEKIWKPIQEPVRELGVAIKELWDEVIGPFVFKYLVPALEWLGREVVPVLFDAIGKTIVGVFKAIAWLILKVVIPTFQLMSRTWSAIWGRKGGLKDQFQAVGSVFKAAGLLIRDIWRDTIKPVFSGFSDIVKGFTKVLRGEAGGWGQIFQGFGKVITGQVNLGISVLNAFIRGFNGLAKAAGLKINIPTITPFSTKKTKKGADDRRTADGFATGGVLPGYTPGRDVHDFYSPTAGRLHLSGGEAIMRPEWTKAMGPHWVNQMNALARMGGPSAVRRAMMGGQAFAKGGVFWPLPGGIASTYSGHDGVDLNSPNDYGKPYYAAVGGRIVYVGSGRGYGDAVFQATKYGTLVYGHSSAIGVRAGQSVAPGQFLGRVGSTGNSTGPHLHFGFPGGTYGQAMALLSGAMKAGYGPASPWAEAGGNIPKMISEFFGGPVKMVKGWYEDSLDKFKKAYSNPMAKVLQAMPGTLVEGVVDTFKDRIPDWMSDVASLSPMGTLLGLLGGKATGSVQEQARKALGEGGFGSWASGSQWSALVALVQKESSWNPNAKNPTSTAEGLFQFLAATRSAYGIKSGASVYDQTLAGAQYIKDRYGSPAKALAFHNRNNWYSDGGVYEAGDSTASPGSSLPYNGTMQYDSGGMLPTGLTTVVNLTGKPERIFTDSQFEAMKAGGGGIHYEPHFEGSDLTSEDVAGDLNFTFKKLSRSGKYAGVGQ